ncbi:MAG: DUF3365 domain-containing protein [Planctomycetaceae bacterium]|nr:DUF3365 domain-containing protein [Planctomycetaceae bacterium]
MARCISPALFLGYLMLASSPAFSEESPAADSSSKPAVRISVEEARRQAEVLHTAMHATVQLVHHRYYKLDEGLPIPAAVVDEIFSEIAAEQDVELRWLAVEGQAMNTDHIARDEFEKAAVEALKAGKPSHEQIQDGIFRRAAPITLSNQCLKCHVPDRKSTEDRKAGLIISIPVAKR